MARQLRHFEPNQLLEVTLRTMQSRLLLRPSDALREIILGILGRAQSLYGLRLHAFVFLSNHFHILCSPTDPEQLARFMGYFNGNLAREIGRLHQWRDRVWARRYKHVAVSDEPAAQIERMKYLLSQGCKEGFVLTPADWPGAHCVDALLNGATLEGTWFNRTLEYEARRRGRTPVPQAFATRETVFLTPLPCWEGVALAVRQRMIAALVAQIEADARAEYATTGKSPLGAGFVRRQNPHDVPRATKRIPAPTVHAASRAVRLAMLEGYRLFVAAYRRASQRFRSGDRSVRFPDHCFPPPSPFTRYGAAEGFG